MQIRKVAILSITISLLLFALSFNAFGQTTRDPKGVVTWEELEAFLQERQEKLINTINRSVESTVTIRRDFNADIGTGSGFFISDKYIITNAHVVKNFDYKLTVTLPDKRYKDAKLLYKDDYRDLAVLEIRDYNSSQYLQLHNDPPRVGETVYTIGNLSGRQFTVVRGMISAIDNFAGRYQIDVTVDYGMSGSPVVNEEGKIVGVICSKLIKRTDTAYAISIDEIKMFLNDANKYADVKL